MTDTTDLILKLRWEADELSSTDITDMSYTMLEAADALEAQQKQRDALADIITRSPPHVLCDACGELLGREAAKQ